MGPPFCRSAAKRFEKELQAESKQVISRFVEFHKTLSLFAFRRILDRSPVWSGRFRGSNTIQIGSADTTVQALPQGLPAWPAPVSRAPKTPARHMLLPKPTKRHRAAYLPVVPHNALSWAIGRLAPEERKALDYIVQNAGVVTVDGGSEYLIVSVTPEVVDTLAAFGAEAEDRELEPDDEIEEDGHRDEDKEPDVDNEPEHDDEPCWNELYSLPGFGIRC